MRIPPLSFVLALATCAPLAASDVFADFAIPDRLPLAKKHSLMNTGSIKLKSHYDRDLGKLGELKAGSLRLDLSIGKHDDAPMWWDVVNGPDPDHLGYNFANVDWLDGELTRQGTLPYWGFVYVPVPFQDPRQPARDWRFLDPDRFDWDRWQEASRTFAGHVRGLHQHGYLEALNEPDLYLPWITGTNTENLKKGYFLRVPDMDTQLEPTTFQMYVRTAKGFKQGDPDAVVGGPALAGAAMQWTGPFLDYVAGNQAPIDFFSFHVISGDDPFSVVVPRTQGVRDQLAGRGWAHSVEIHMNEYNAYGHPWDQDTDSSDLATHVIENCHDLLGQHDLTVVSWAQAMDNSQVQGAVNGDQTAGLIDWDGNRRRAFTAFAMYGDIPMPSFRSNDDGSVHTMAGADATKAGIIVWNSDGANSTDVTVTAHHIPFANAVFRLVVIDPTGTGNPQGLNPSVQETQAITNPMFRGVHLPPRSVAYLSWTSTTAPALAAPAGQVVRVHHDYPNRATHSWAEYDRRAWTACLGMEDANDLQIVGTTVRDLAATVHVSCRTAGAPASGTLGLRIDYLTGGGYTKSVLFHGGLAAGFTVPWGSGRPVDQSVAIALADADIVPGDFAPAGWLGQAVVTYVMNRTGNGTRATFVLSAGGSTGTGTGTRDWNGDWNWNWNWNWDRNRHRNWHRPAHRRQRHRPDGPVLRHQGFERRGADAHRPGHRFHLGHHAAHRGHRTDRLQRALDGHHPGADHRDLHLPRVQRRWRAPERRRSAHHRPLGRPAGDGIHGHHRLDRRARLRDQSGVLPEHRRRDRAAAVEHAVEPDARRGAAVAAGPGGGWRRRNRHRRRRANPGGLRLERQRLRGGHRDGGADAERAVADAAARGRRAPAACVRRGGCERQLDHGAPHGGVEPAHRRRRLRAGGAGGLLGAVHALLRAARQEVGELQEALPAARLGEEVARRDEPVIEQVLVLRHRGEDVDRRAVEDGVGAHVAQQLRAGHGGQVRVEQDAVRRRHVAGADLDLEVAQGVVALVDHLQAQGVAGDAHRLLQQGRVADVVLDVDDRRQVVRLDGGHGRSLRLRCGPQRCGSGTFCSRRSCTSLRLRRLAKL